MKTKEGEIEGRESKEQWTSKIVLSFFRHGEAEEAKEKRDVDIRLTQRGREQAIEKSEEGTDISKSVAIGSPRERAQETAGFVMAGRKEGITDKETLKKLVGKLGFESKMRIDEKLDFPIPKNEEFRKRTSESFEKGEWLKFLVEESDKLAEKYNEKEGLSYSLAASNVAEIIKKHFKIFSRWSESVKKKEKHFDTFKRFLGTHQGVGECFLAKIIELKGEEKKRGEGIKRRDEFVKALDNQGFDYVEGFDVEILKKEDKEPIIKIDYTKKENNKVIFEIHEEIDKEFLDKLIIKNEE
jgi:broad specificity phosphatase PhoE